MQREQLEQLITSMDTESLLKMLQVVGVNIQPEAESQLMTGGDEKIPSWNDERVEVTPKPKAPIFDASSFIKDLETKVTGEQQQQMPDYVTGQPPAMEDWYANGPVNMG